MTKAYAYLRVSGKSQVEGDGFTRQRLTIDGFAAAQGFHIVKEYRDEGVSGTKELANREALAALLAAVETTGVRAVLVERSDRLARDFAVSELILRDFRKAGVKVYDADSGEELTLEDPNDPTRKLVRTILRVLAAYDREVTVLKLRHARERIRRSGQRCEGRKPFGTREGEPEALRRLQALRAEGLTLRAIAETLNAERVQTRAGGAWKAGTVHDILRRVAA